MLPAIEVSGLGKRYVIEHESRHDNLRDTLHHTARKLWRRVRWGTGFDREEFWALRDVSFSVRSGEVVGIVGRNGAGKSTLLKLLSRITEPTAGRITVRGRVASLLEVGTGFHPELTGRENIFLNGAILGMKREEIRRKFDEIVAFAEVERFLDTPVKRYSSGMYVRLAFAVAAHLEPEILIVDEVLAVGDVQFQRKCLGKMRDVARNSGRTVLFVSHNLAAVRQLCDRCLLLQGGNVRHDGATSEVLAAFEGGEAETGFVFDPPHEVLPGLAVTRAAGTCTPSDRTPWSTLAIHAAGTMNGKAAAYGFGLQITTPDGMSVSRIGARFINGFVNGRDGGWAVRLEVPEINRILAGGRYHVSVLVNETMSSGKTLTPAPFVVDVPESDPYGVGANFSAPVHGLVALPAILTELPPDPSPPLAR